MKSRTLKLAVLLFVSLFCFSTFAQWQTNASGNIYYTKGTPSPDYVGIGTNAPECGLDIRGNTTPLRFDHVGFVQNPSFTITQNANYKTSWNRIETGCVSGIGFGEADGKIFLFNDPNTTGTPTLNVRMVIFGNGNVGIGTDFPGTYKLAVEGKIGARELVVTTAAWADKVFKNDYNLKPISEVEKFIKANNHLEGIPTEKEVKTNGVAVGEMEGKLLQKVEELTLYVIDQNKKIENQNNKISQLLHSHEMLNEKVCSSH